MSSSSTGGDAGGEEGGDDGKPDETELETSSAAGEPPIPLAEGEEITFTEARAKLQRWKPAESKWGDLGIGALRVVVKAGTSARLVFSAAVGVRERVLLSGALEAKMLITSNASPDAGGGAGAKAGGLIVHVIVLESDGSAKVARCLLKVRLQSQQDAMEKAIRDGLPPADPAKA